MTNMSKVIITDPPHLYVHVNMLALMMIMMIHWKCFKGIISCIYKVN